MSYRGRVKEGVVVLEGGIRLAEGTEVEVLPVAQTPTPPAGGLGQRLLKHAATVKGMPSDLARNHDYYIRAGPVSLPCPCTGPCYLASRASRIRG